MNKLKKLNIFLIIAVVAFSYIATAYQSFVPKVRTVELQEETVDYNNYFSEYYDAELEYKEDSNELIFTGTRDLPASIFSEIDLVDNEELANDIPITYTFDYLADTNEFYLSIVANIEGGEIIDRWYGVPFTTEDGKTDIVFNTGDELVCLSELEESGLINNCGWFSRLCKKIVKVAVVVAVVAVVAAVVVTAPAVVAAAPVALATTAGTVVTGVAATGALASAASAGATLLGVGVAAATVAVGAYVASEVANDVKNSNKNESNKTKGDNKAKNGDKVPNYPGNNPSKKPGNGYEWKGSGNPSSGKGSWYNPKTGESLHPDLNHQEPYGPHWDYKAPSGNEYRIFPDGSFGLK